MTGTVAVVPIRGSVGAKTRLANMFTEDERSRLVWHMLRRVVRAIDESSAIDHTLIVTYEPEVASRYVDEDDGHTILPQPVDVQGLNAALHAGRTRAHDLGFDRMITLSADLPTVTSEDVELLAAHRSPVVIVPDLHNSGTNALSLKLASCSDGCLAAASRFAFQFGHDSRDRHLAEARQLGLASSVFCRDGLARDLDTLDDWGSLPGKIRDELRSVARQSLMTPNP